MHRNVILPYSSGYFRDALDSGSFSVVPMRPMVFPGPSFRASTRFPHLPKSLGSKQWDWWNNVLVSGVLDLPKLVPFTFNPYTPIPYKPAANPPYIPPAPSVSAYIYSYYDWRTRTFVRYTDYRAWGSAMAQWNAYVNSIWQQQRQLEAEILAYNQEVARKNAEGRAKEEASRKAKEARDAEILEIELLKGRIELRNQQVEFVVSKQRIEAGRNWDETYQRRRDRKQNQAYLRALETINRTYGHELWEIAGAFANNLYYSDGPLKDQRVRFGRLSQFYKLVQGVASGKLYLDFPGFLAQLAYEQLEDRFYGEIGSRVRKEAVDSDRLFGVTMGPTF